jgi:hypothetical protein
MVAGFAIGSAAAGIADQTLRHGLLLYAAVEFQARCKGLLGRPILDQFDGTQ